jgi:hypothetical protein
MTLDVVFRDVMSMLNQQRITSEQVYPADVYNAINDVISGMMVSATEQRRNELYAVTETLTGLTTDTDYPFLVSKALTRSLIQSANPTRAVIRANVSEAESALANAIATVSAGAIRVKGDKRYKCLNSFSGINTFEKTFTGSDFRFFSNMNGATFAPGDVIYRSGIYWRVLESFVNDTEQTFSEGARFEQVYWVELGDAYKTASVLSPHRINELKLYGINNQYGSGAVCVIDDKLYTTPNNKNVTISYIPEWVKVVDPSAQLNVPEEWLTDIKMQSARRVALKLGVRIEGEDDNS